MITPILERAILRGDATYCTWNHAYGMFGRIPMQDGKIAVIEKIIWNNFINPYALIGSGLTFGMFLRYNEYQLKIDGKKSVNYFQFRNHLLLSKMDNTVINLNTALTSTNLATLSFQAGPPVIIDTFLVCEKRIKLTISRNNWVFSYNNTPGVLNASAGEAAAPNGVGDITNMLERTEEVAVGAVSEFYTPPSNEFAAIAGAAPNRNHENHFHDFKDKDNAGALQSTLTMPGEGFAGLMQGVTHPLLTLGIVYVNRDIADQLQSSG